MPEATHSDTLIKRVNDALLDSLASNNANGDTNHRNISDNNTNNVVITDENSVSSDDELETKLYTNDNDVLNTKIEFEEVPNYNEIMIEEFKRKYTVFGAVSPVPNNHNNTTTSTEHNNINILNNTPSSQGKLSVKSSS